MAHVASIFHLTDLHLLIEGDGRPPSFWKGNKLRWIAQSRLPLVDGLGHDEDAWRAVKRRLPVMVQREERLAPVVVVQSGDVEALGGMGDGTGYDRFPGFAELHRLRDTVLDRTDRTCWLDLYGNHDVWTHAWAPTIGGVEAITAIDGLGDDWPHRTDHPGTGRRVELIRINTVDPSAASGALAWGLVGSHLPAMNPEEAMTKVSEIIDPTDAPIRIAVSHHPVHCFNWTKYAHTGLLRGRKVLGQTATTAPLHLLLAGHMHAFDPPQGAGATTRQGNQRPLTASSGQLVAQSPTKHKTMHAITIYRLHDDGGLLSVDRVVSELAAGQLNFENPHEPGFPEDRLFSGIPL